MSSGSYPLGLYKPTLGWSRYRDTNPVPTSPLADDIIVPKFYLYVEWSQTVLIAVLCLGVCDAVTTGNGL